jgi:Na+/melibiose symporter-like transporter
MDLPGLALMGTGLFTGMFAATYMGEPGARLWSVAFAVPFVVTVAAIGLFIRHINQAAYPSIVPRLLHGPSFGIINLYNILYGGAAGGVRTLIPLYAINLYGMSAFDSGTLLIAQGIAAVLFSATSAFVLRFTGYRLPMYIGGFVIACGTLLLSLDPAGGMPPYAWLACGAFLMGVGGGIINPASRNAGLQLDPEKAPAIAAIRSMDMQIGRITTISVVTAILASSSAPGHTQAWIYLVAAASLVATLPIVTRVPEHRGAW